MLVFSMLDVSGNLINKSDMVIVGAGEEFDKYTFRCFDTKTNLAFIKPLGKNSMSIQALPQLIHKVK